MKKLVKKRTNVSKKVELYNNECSGNNTCSGNNAVASCGGGSGSSGGWLVGVINAFKSCK